MFFFFSPCPTAHVSCVRVCDVKSEVSVSSQMVSVIGMQVALEKVVCITVYHHSLYLGNHTYGCRMAGV